MDLVDANGARIPKIGLGTFQLQGHTGRSMVDRAMDLGYRHIDTAQMYGNEDAVGQGIRDNGIDREAIRVTTKIWPDRFRDGDLQHAAAESLDRLGMDYVDLLLLHWPNPAVPLEETIPALNAVCEQGLARHIGISNFPVRLLKQAVSLSSAPLVNNQVEYHPYLSQRTLLTAVREAGMSLTAYCPLGRGEFLSDPVIGEIAHRHGRQPAQIVLRWHYQQPDVIAIPRTSNPEHLRGNLDILDFALDAQEMAAIHGLARPDGRMVSPAGLAPQWDRDDQPD